MSDSCDRVWHAFLASGTPVAVNALAEGATYTSWQFGYGVDQGNRLLDHVIHGVKRGTAGALATYEHEGDTVPVPGEFSVVLDGQGEARCVIMTTRVDVVPFDQVDAEHAASEGEGDLSHEFWRRVHWDYFTRELAGFGENATSDMPIVCERFDLVYVAEDPTPDGVAD